MAFIGNLLPQAACIFLCSIIYQAGECIRVSLSTCFQYAILFYMPALSSMRSVSFVNNKRLLISAGAGKILVSPDISRRLLGWSGVLALFFVVFSAASR
jgi:hypothetical protein